MCFHAAGGGELTRGKERLGILGPGGTSFGLSRRRHAGTPAQKSSFQSRTAINAAESAAVLERPRRLQAGRVNDVSQSLCYQQRSRNVPATSPVRPKKKPTKRKQPVKRTLLKLSNGYQMLRKAQKLLRSRRNVGKFDVRFQKKKKHRSRRLNVTFIPGSFQKFPPFSIRFIYIFILYAI